jgi:hypothetical protein
MAWGNCMGETLLSLAGRKGYYPSVFQSMRMRHGTIAAIEKLVQSGEIQSGFKRLKDLGLLEWSIEAAVIRFAPGHANVR